MEEEFMDTEEGSEVIRSDAERAIDISKDLDETLGIEDNQEDDESGGNFRGRGRGGAFRGRGRGPPLGPWMNGPPPMRFRGRGYGPGGPPMRGRGFFRGRGGPRFNNGPNFDNNWGPMGPPPPGMMGGPPPFGPPPGMMPPGGPMGPPPNMMGQAPPYGGPPGMPPPNMPAPELWVETKSDNGNSYYYHSRTRETTWTRPQESPTCKVITQAEMENLVNSSSSPYSKSYPMSMAANPAMGGPPMGMMANGMMGAMMPPGVGPQSGPTAGAVTPYMSQPPPWGNKDSSGNSTMVSDIGKKDDEDVPQMRDSTTARAQRIAKINKVAGLANVAASMAASAGAGSTGVLAPPVVIGAPVLNAGSALTGAPAAMGPGPMGQGAAGAPGMGPRGPWGWGWPQPIAAQPSGRATAALPDAVPYDPVSVAKEIQEIERKRRKKNIAAKFTAGAATQKLKSTKEVDRKVTSKSHDETRIPSELAALAAEWTTHMAPDGRTYYYHVGRQESVWEKPNSLQELEDYLTNIAVGKPEKKEPEIIQIKEENDIEVVDVEAHALAAAEAEAAAKAAAQLERERVEKERLDKERAEKERVEAERLEKEREAKEKALADLSRPKTSMPISGTPWCVVWTGDGRVFFYNPTANSSVWERPVQLVGRADVDKAVSQPPESLADLQKKGNPGVGVQLKGSNGELKRPNESHSDDSDVEPAKKAKPIDKEAAATASAAVAAAKKTAAAIDAGKDAAIEAEIRAARVRAVVPFEQRVRSFLQLLHESDVSAFSPWEKELHKIVFDSSYLLLNTKERKQVFDRYVRERAEEERKEKNNRLQQKKNDFRHLMEEAKLHPKSSFTDFSSKYSREERFKGIEKLRDRKTYFNEYIAELRKKEKEDKDKKREQVKTEFIALLKEKAVDRHARWVDVKKKVDTDVRYKAVESSAFREDYFREYCKLVKEERKKDKDGKDKEKERERPINKKEKKEKDKDKEKDKTKEKDKDKENQKDKEKDKEGKKEKKKDKAEPETTIEQEAHSTDEETSEVEAEAEAEAEGEADEALDEEARREREARAAASIKQREKQVQLALASSLRDRDKEREYHKRDEAVQHFNALLADLVRNPDLTWREAKKQLKKDHRYVLAKPLNKDDMERLFVLHTSSLSSKRRERLRTLLAELGVSCDAPWRDARRQLERHPSAPTYASAVQMEREFRDYQRDKQTAAKTAFKQLLLETRTLTHRTLAAVKGQPAAMQALVATLHHDSRYTALDHVTDQREAILTNYLEELQTKGPPPPPTASEPARRAK